MSRTVGMLIFVYALALAQTSFLPHLFFWGITPNLVVIAVLALSILEKPDSHSSLIAAVFGGLLLDLFSTATLIGFWTLALAAGSGMIKALAKNYVRIPILKKR